MCPDIEKKIEKEKEILGFMINLYCRKKHGLIGGSICESCRSLESYAFSKCDSCPLMETKTFCSNCKVHCYRPDMRDHIRMVMRYSGPRMIFYRPRDAFRYLRESKKEKKGSGK